MNKKIVFGVILVCLLALGLVFGSCTKAEAQSSSSRWEYIGERYSNDRANELGQQGWELVTVWYNPVNGPNAVFKRKL